MNIGGYVGKLLRVDLTSGTTIVEPLSQEFIETWVGGVGFGVRILHEEVPAGVEWDDPENRMVWTAGPLGGSGVYGAGTFNVAAKGPMTGLAGASQANGFMGAYMKFSGVDGIVFTGRSPELVYLHIEDGAAELRDARHLAGKDLFELEDCLREELGVKGHQVSVYGIGPAGEQGVRFAAIGGDGGHLAAHNGLGAVMGAKNLKAVVAHRGKRNFPIHDGATAQGRQPGHVRARQGLRARVSVGHRRRLLRRPRRRPAPRPQLHDKHLPRAREHERTVHALALRDALDAVLQVRVRPREGSHGDRGPLRGIRGRGTRVRAAGRVGAADRQHRPRCGRHADARGRPPGHGLQRGLVDRRLGHGVLREGASVQRGPGRSGPALGQRRGGTGVARPDGCPRGYRGAAGGRGEACLRERRRRGRRPRRLHAQGRQPPQSRPSRSVGRSSSTPRSATRARSSRRGPAYTRNWWISPR